MPGQTACRTNSIRAQRRDQATAKAQVGDPDDALENIVKALLAEKGG